MISSKTLKKRKSYSTVKLTVITLASLLCFWFWLIRSFTDPTHTGSIFVCVPLHPLYLVRGHAFRMWHWLIRKHLNSSFIWGHYLVHYSRQLALKLVALFFAATPCRRDPTRSKQLPTVAILGFRFGLYQVLVALSRLGSNQPCFIVISQVTIFP